MKKLFLKQPNKKINLNKSSQENSKEIDKNKNSNLNQPSTTTSSREQDSNKFRKIVWITTGFVIFGLIIGAIVISSLGSGPRQHKVHSIEINSKDKYTVYEDADKKLKKEIERGKDVPSFFYGPNGTLRLSFGNNSKYFYYVITTEKAEWTLSNTTNNATDENKATITDTIFSFGQYKISGATGMIFEFDTNILNYKIYDDWQNNWLGETFKSAYNNLQMPSSGFDWTIILNLLPIVISIVFFVILFRMMKGAGQGGGQESVFSIGKSQAKIAQSNVKFVDVAGIEEEKNELIEIVDYLKRPERYVAMGARVPKGVILYGPPGTGKTLLAKAVAGEANVPFFQVSGSAFEDMLVGVGAKRVRDLFSKAVKASPAIIFIDEIDSVGSKRGKLETTSGSLADQTLNQLLAEMDGFSQRSGVIVIAATNRLDVLDDALLRPGRFDRHIQVNLPDIKERTAILKIHARNKNLSSTVELEDIARRTPGFSGAQLENVLNEATLLAVRKDKTSINTEDLDEAIDRVIAGPAKKTKVISAEEKKQIAYHEAGHALVGLYIKGGDVVQKITIIPRGQAAGYTLSVPEIQELSIQRKSDLLGMIASTLGGRASEEIVYGKESVSTGASNDLYKVTNIVRAMVMQLGMSSVGMTQYVPSEGVVNPYQTKMYSENTALAIDKEIDKIINKQYEVAISIINKNRKELDLIVESLLLLETIVKPQIDYIHKHLKLPKEALEKKEELMKKKSVKEKKDNEKKQVSKEENNDNSVTKKNTTKEN